MNRHEFWQITVARLHYDPTVILTTTCYGLVDADDHQNVINSNLSLPQRRNCAWLKDRFLREALWGGVAQADKTGDG